MFYTIQNSIATCFIFIHFPRNFWVWAGRPSHQLFKKVLGLRQGVEIQRDQVIHLPEGFRFTYRFSRWDIFLEKTKRLETCDTTWIFKPTTWKLCRLSKKHTLKNGVESKFSHQWCFCFDITIMVDVQQGMVTSQNDHKPTVACWHEIWPPLTPNFRKTNEHYINLKKHIQK